MKINTTFLNVTLSLGFIGSVINASMSSETQAEMVAWISSSLYSGISLLLTNVTIKRD